MEIIRGQRASFFDAVGPAFSATLELQGVDPLGWRFLCLMVNDKGKALDGSSVYFDANQRSPCGTVTPKGRDGASFQIDLGRAPAALTSLVFAVAFVVPPTRGRTTANQITQGVLKIQGPNGGEILYRLAGSDFGQEAAVVLLEVYRKDPWRLMAVGSGFLGGIGAMLSRYDVSNDVIRAVESGEAPLVVADVDNLSLPQAWPGGVTPRVPSGVLPAVGIVLVEDGQGNSGSGTCFAISPGGFLITCAHVIEGATKIGVVMEGKSVIRPAIPTKCDTSLDVAMLYLGDRSGCESWFSITRSDANVEIGQEVGILGYPLRGALGANVSYSHGIVNSIRRRQNGTGQVLQVDAGAAPGSSGAPVFSRADGTVIGVLSSGLDNSAGMLINFAVDLRNVHRLGWFSA